MCTLVVVDAWYCRLFIVRLAVFWHSRFLLGLPPPYRISLKKRKEGRKWLFSVTPNIFYLRLYCVGHMVTDNSARWKLATATWATLFRLAAKVLFYMHHHTDRIAHTIAFVTPVVEHWLEREIAQWVHHEGSIRRPIAPWADPLPRSLTKSQNSTRHRSVGQSLEHWVNVLLVVLF